MTDGNDSARGRVYAPLEDLLKSGGEELLLDPPAPPGYNIGVMVVCLDPVRWNSLCTTASSSRENSFWRKVQLSILKSWGSGGTVPCIVIVVKIENSSGAETVPRAVVSINVVNMWRAMGELCEHT